MHRLDFLSGVGICSSLFGASFSNKDVDLVKLKPVTLLALTSIGFVLTSISAWSSSSFLCSYWPKSAWRLLLISWKGGRKSALKFQQLRISWYLNPEEKESWSNSAEICIGCFGKTRSSLNVGKIVML